MQAIIMHDDRNAVEFQVDGVADCFSIIKHDFFSYILLNAFAPITNEKTALTYLNGTISGNYVWK